MVSAAAFSLPLGAQLVRQNLSGLNLSASSSSRYELGDAWPGITFDQPVAIVTVPGRSDRVFVVEKTGRVQLVLGLDSGNPTKSEFIDISNRLNSAGGEQGLLAMAVHPDFANNGRFFLWFTTNSSSAAGQGRHDRLAEFSVRAGNTDAGDPTSERTLISQYDEAGNHNGGELAFGPDGYLYLSTGDEGGANDQYHNSQRIDRDFFSAILRLDVDQGVNSMLPNVHPAVHPGTYRVPADNPWIGATSFLGRPISAAAVRTEFWAVGLRNPWRFSFDPQTGDLWCADVGQNRQEEVNVIVRGGHYGWDFREGDAAGPGGNAPSGQTFVDPVWVYPRTEGISVTGGLVYRGSHYPGLAGKYLFADYLSGRLWSLAPNGTGTVEDSAVELLLTDGGIVSFGLDPNSTEILVADITDGRIKRLVQSEVPDTAAYPATLAETGALADVSSLTPAAGWVAYEPIHSFWSDHATKRRWFGLQAGSEPLTFSEHGPWGIGAGAVWMKHFDLETRRGDPSSARRIETRFLVRTPTGGYGITYQWNEAGTAATLVPDEGAEASFAVEEDGEVLLQRWHYPSRAECITCHNEPAGFALSFNTRQLNQSHAFGASTENQITALAAAGYLTPTTPPSPESLPRLTREDDPGVSIGQRVRTYMDVNCAMCHQPGGTAPFTWDARARTPFSIGDLSNSGSNTATDTTPAAELVDPKSAELSWLLDHMRGSNGAQRMPPLATLERDVAAEELLRAWIAEIDAINAPSRLLNLGVRAQAGQGDETLIVGFVVEGNAARPFLVRAGGPALREFGVEGPLSDPSIRVFAGETRILTNDNWTTATAAVSARVGAFPFATGSLDSAIVSQFTNGAHTAHVTSTDGSGGVALLELYDAGTTDEAVATRLTNVSVRAKVGTGSAVLIPGLVIGEGNRRQILVRAVGPGLGNFGLNGVLAKPRVTLYQNGEALLANEGWLTADDPEAIRTAGHRMGAFALAESGEDSALLLDLSAGVYTLLVEGSDGGTGVALVEIYDVTE